MGTVQDIYGNDVPKEDRTNHLGEMFQDMHKQLREAGNIKIGDAFSNPELDLGMGTYDPTLLGLYPQARTLTWNLQRIESVMRADPFFTRALEWRSSKPLINGIDISSDDIEAEQIEAFQKDIQCMINPPLKEGLFEADGFGWSALLIMIDGEINPTALKKPLDVSKIKKDKFLGLKPLTRWYQINPSQKMIKTIGKVNQIYDPRLLGTPEYYNVSFDQDKGNMMEVHRSRLVIIPRNKLSFIEKKVEHYGGTSLLEQSFESLTRFHSLVAQIHRILQKSVIPILKLEDIQISGLQNEAGQKAVEAKLKLIRENLSSHNMLVVGDGDNLEFVEAQLANMEKMLEQAKIQVCASHNTPRSVLFLEDDATADDDRFNDFIKERQEFLVKEIYNYLLPILYRSKYGEDIPSYTMKFKPLETPSLKETAEARKLNVESLDILYKMNVLDVESIQKSLADIDNNPQDVFRNLTKEYRKEIESGDFATYNSHQIDVAEALNKDGQETIEEKVEGRQRGGDPTASKPTPKTTINQEKKKEG